MGDSEFKNSLKIFTIFEPTATRTSIQALITISYRMGGKEQKLEKEVEISKNNQSSTGYVFTIFRST
ncbi:hypothetical protein B9Z55_006439 [Caenorhabditis nigoni]|uniref:Uncharacterized protein n=1 Tax=Caenorhabditis nigoni TaxID=1611254 RepID=A0A2G5V545_9PELO|nr:hypothetical protein B9Z55_006439 [Caenorhabditis nigoni]